MRGLVAVVMALVGAWARPAVADAEPQPGKIVEVACKADPAQRYSCYLPAAYDASRTWPILYCFSPSANGGRFVQDYEDVCERRGWIVVGSLTVGSGDIGPIREGVVALWNDTEARFALSPTRRYASGFSAGSRVSFMVAEMYPQALAGVIGIGAGLPPGDAMPRKDLSVFLTCGKTDPNVAELDPLSKRLREAGNPVHYETFEGGHDMPPVPLMAKAVDWIDELHPEVHGGRLAAAVAEARELEGKGEPAAAWLRVRAAITTNARAPAKALAEAEELRKDLERDPAVKKELAAEKALAGVHAWREKNKERLAGFETVRAELRRKLEDVATKFAGTDAARRAAEEAADGAEAPEETAPK